jgi:3-hydroxybutyryl-CoA dehydrogenase
MGIGIAQIIAENGFEVFWRDIEDRFIEKGMAALSANLDKLISKEKLTAAAKKEIIPRIHVSTNINFIKDVDFVFEAVPEDIEIKKSLFAEIDGICKPEAIFATNTSSLSITEIGSAVHRPDKVIGFHFFNPIAVMQLVEIIKGLGTTEETRESMIKFAKTIGKTPVYVEEQPGFVVNRILIPMINEAIGVLADGVAKAEDIDMAMKLGANHPIGPLKLGDMIGLDVCLAIMNVLYAEFGDQKYRPHPLLKKMVRAKYLGRKTGQGFYKY